MSRRCCRPSPHAEEFATTGQLGVTFFYLLSGFVLTWTFRPGDRAGGFYGRRFARVWPLHIVTTVLAGLVLLIVGGELNYRALPFVATMTHAFVPDPEVYQAFNTPSWSLSVEAFFYALFPLLIMVLARVRRPLQWATAVFGLAVVATALVFAVAGTVAGLVGQSRQGFIGYTLYFFPPYRLAEFTIGILIGVAVLRGWRTRRSLRAASATAGAALAVLTALLWIWDHPSKMPLASLMMIPFFALVVGAAATTDVIGKTSWLQHPALVRLGRASFALYLVHFSVIELTEKFLPGIPVPAAALVAVGCSILLADVLHSTIERPAERALRRRFGQRRVLPVVETAG